MINTESESKQSQPSVKCDTLQQVNDGRVVSIDFDPINSDSYLFSSSSKYAHFTGQMLDSATLIPPECEFTTQTLSTRAAAENTTCVWRMALYVNIFGCCPDVYYPTEEACVSEADGSNLCHGEYDIRC